jgi:hypothetical protein
MAAWPKTIEKDIRQYTSLYCLRNAWRVEALSYFEDDLSQDAYFVYLRCQRSFDPYRYAQPRLLPYYQVAIENMVNKLSNTARVIDEHEVESYEALVETDMEPGGCEITSLLVALWLAPPEIRQIVDVIFSEETQDHLAESKRPRISNSYLCKRLGVDRRGRKPLDELVEYLS